jgi:deazaflavin-dependent oxidoreductase (nitroreductase family)
VSARDTLTDFGFKAVNVLHRGVMKLGIGKKGYGMPVVELHTTGRKSGLDRTSVLTSPLQYDGTWVFVASKGGNARNPEWYLNLVANPNVEIHVGGKVHKLRARTSTPEEKKDLWPKILAAHKGYGNYQKRTTRDIPVVICEPAS